MPYKEKEVKKVRWTIGQLAKMIHRDTSALRFWEDKFPWIKPLRTVAGKRYYKYKDVEEVMRVSFLLRYMTIEGVIKVHEFGYDKQLAELFYKKEVNHIPTRPEQVEQYPLTEGVYGWMLNDFL